MQQEVRGIGDTAVTESPRWAGGHRPRGVRCARIAWPHDTSRARDPQRRRRGPGAVLTPRGSAAVAPCCAVPAEAVFSSPPPGALRIRSAGGPVPVRRLLAGQCRDHRRGRRRAGDRGRPGRLAAAPWRGDPRRRPGANGVARSRSAAHRCGAWPRTPCSGRACPHGVRAHPTFPEGTDPEATGAADTGREHPSRDGTTARPPGRRHRARRARARLGDGEAGTRRGQPGQRCLGAQEGHGLDHREPGGGAQDRHVQDAKPVARLDPGGLAG